MAEERQSAKDQDAEPIDFPKSYQHRISMKWLTIEALRVALLRVNHSKPGHRAVLFTSFGWVEAEIDEVRPSSAESYDQMKWDQLDPDIGSLTANIRFDLLIAAQEQDKELNITDSAALVILKNVRVQQQGQERHLPQLIMFADQIVGYTVTKSPQLH